MNKHPFLPAAALLLAACGTTTRETPDPSKSAAPAADALAGTSWRLVEIMGRPVEPADAGAREATISFATDEQRVFGSTGCNRFSGTYEVLDGNRIRFSQVATTMMACLDMETEAAMLDVLGTADNYSLAGTEMTLNKARMAPLARFVAAPPEE